MKKCLTVFFISIIFLFVNGTNTYAYNNASSFSFRYIKGVSSENVNETLSISVNGNREIVIYVDQLTGGAELSVNSVYLDPENTVISDIGVYRIALSQQATSSSSIITVNMRLSANINATATGSIGLE